MLPEIQLLRELIEDCIVTWDSDWKKTQMLQLQKMYSQTMKEKLKMYSYVISYNIWSLYVI